MPPTIASGLTDTLLPLHFRSRCPYLIDLFWSKPDSRVTDWNLIVFVVSSIIRWEDTLPILLPDWYKALGSGVV